MLDILAIVQIVAALLLVAPLIVIVVCALRRAGRQIDRILEEECGQDAHVPEAREPAHVERSTAGRSARSVRGSSAR